MQREALPKIVKMKMFAYELSVGEIPESFEDKVNFLRAIGRKADKDFKEKYKNISLWFKEYDAIYLLSFCVHYFLSHEEGYDEEVEKGFMEYPPHFQEILQAFSLYSQRAITAKPLYNEVEEFKRSMREIGDLSIRRMHDIPEKLKTEEEVNAYRLRTEMMVHTLAVRSWAYHHQMEKITKDLCVLIRDSFVKIHGVAPWPLFHLFSLMIEKVNDRMNTHRTKMGRVLSQKTYSLICDAYESEFPDIIKIGKQSQESLWDHCGKDIGNFRVVMLSHSDLFLGKGFTFSIDEMSEMSEGELSKDKIIFLFEKLSFCFGELENFNRDYFILGNPVHDRPFIKIEDGKYYTSLWGLLPDISIKILENFVNENEELSNKYNIVKASYLEDEVENLFRINFPDAQVFRGNYWKGNDGKDYENDLLVFIGSFAIVVEAKSGVLSSAAKRGAPDRLFKNLQGLIEEPSEQALRFINFLKQNDTEVIFFDKSRKKFIIDTSKIKYHIPLGVTFSQLGMVSTNLKLLIEAGVTKRKIHELATSISLTDLQIIFELLPTQALKIHYLQRRREFEANFQYTGDEMDLLAFYLDTGFNLGKKEFEDQWYFNLILKSKELDPYIISNSSGIYVNMPQIKLTKWWRDILDFIDKRKPEKWLETSFILLNLNYEEQVEFEKLFKTQAENIIAGKMDLKHNWIIFSSANPQRRFVVIGYPYQNIQLKERNLMMEDMIFNEDKDDLKGALVIAVNLDKEHYPYSAMMTQLSAKLFDSKFL